MILTMNELVFLVYDAYFVHITYTLDLTIIPPNLQMIRHRLTFLFVLQLLAGKRRILWCRCCSDIIDNSGKYHRVHYGGETAAQCISEKRLYIFRS